MDAIYEAGIPAETAARTAALPAAPAITANNPPQEPDIDTTRKYASSIRSWERNEAYTVSFLMRKDKIPYEASEAFQSITTRIALDAAEGAANRHIPYDIIATPDRIEALWKLSDTYRTEYATGAHAYNSSKIDLTVTKAISAGRAKYEELMKRRAPAAAEIIEDEEAEEEPKISPEQRAAELEKQAVRMDEIAKECGPVIEGMYQYYITNYLMYQPEIALFVALWSIGTICGRVWETDRFKIKTPHARVRIPPTTTTDYLTILAKTGAGKENIKSALRKFLGFVDFEIPTPSNATSASAIYTEMMLHPRLMLLLDEAGRERRGAGSGKGDAFGPKAAETLLMAVYSNRTGDLKPSLYAPGRDNPYFRTIRRNAISCVLISTPETYQDALQSDDAEGGYLSRFVMLHSTRPRDSEWNEIADDDDDDDDTLLDAFREWLPYHAGMPELDTYGQLIRPDVAAVWTITKAYDKIKAARASAWEMRNRAKHYEATGSVIFDEGRPACIVKWDKEARDEIASIYNQNELYMKKRPDAAPLLTRKTEHIMKCAMVLALANSAIGTPQETLTEPPAYPDKLNKPDMNKATEIEVKHYETVQYAKCRSVYEIVQKAGSDIERSSACYAIQEAAEKIADIHKKRAKLKNAIEQMNDAEDEDAKNKIDEQIKDMVKKAGVKKDEENEQIVDDVEILQEHYRKALTEASEAERKARTLYNAKNDAIETAVKRMYEQHAPKITKKYVELAEVIIGTVGNASLDLIDSIPMEDWVKLKEETVTLVKKAGSRGIPRSVVEKKINDRGRQQDKCATLINQLMAEEVLDRGHAARNGGYRLYIRGMKPEDA